MPITITPLGPTGAVGWGVSVNLTTDFIGPLPLGTNWLLTTAIDAEQTQQVSSNRLVDNINPTVMRIGAQAQEPILGTFSARNGQTIHVQALLEDGAHNVLDSGTTTATWDTTSSEAQFTAQLVQQGVTGGFTTDDRTTIQQTLEGLTVPLTAVGQALTTTVGQLLAPFRIDFSPSISLSGGVTCEPLRLNLSGAAFYGIKVHVVTIPDDWRFGTPDGDWGFHDLAVLSCWINEDQLVRCGIHTPSFVLTPLPGTATPFVSSAIAELQPPGYSVHVDWAPGVCGEVLGINLPVLL
jgi:hypothetical protein